MNAVSEQLLTEASELITAAVRFARHATRIPTPTRSVVAWRVLALLESGGPQRVSTLSHSERITQPTMTGVIARLADGGLVDRQADPSDGRATLAAITPAGARELALFRTNTAAQLSPAITDMTPEQRHILAQATILLNALTTRLTTETPQRDEPLDSRKKHSA